MMKGKKARKAIMRDAANRKAAKIATRKDGTAIKGDYIGPDRFRGNKKAIAAWKAAGKPSKKEMPGKPVNKKREYDPEKGKGNWTHSAPDASRRNRPPGAPERGEGGPPEGRGWRKEGFKGKGPMKRKGRGPRHGMRTQELTEDQQKMHDEFKAKRDKFKEDRKAFRDARKNARNLSEAVTTEAAGS